MVSSDPDIAHETAAGHEHASLDEPLPADELRERMRLRLARSRADGPPPIRPLPGSGAPLQPTTWPSSAGSGLPIIAGGRGQHGEVNQLVWNSVLESLSTGTTATDPVPTPPGLTTLAPTPHQTSAPTLLPLPSDPGGVPAIAAAAAPAPLPDVTPSAEPAPVFIGATHDEPAWIVPTEYGPALAEPVRSEPLAAAPTLPPILVTEAALAATEPDDLPRLADHQPFDVPVPAPVPVLGRGPLGRTGPSPRPLTEVFGDESAMSKRSARHGPTPITMQSYAQRRARRHPIRSFLSFVLVLALLGGAAYAGWYKFLRNKVTWTKDLQPSVDFVESTVHRTFEENVTVTTLSPPEYEVKLGLDALARLDPGTDMIAFRAVGLLDAAPSAAEIGRVLAPSTTSFYDTVDRGIYRLAGTTAAFEVGLIRALTIAIVDQDIGVTKTMSTLTYSQRVGLRAMIDGVANVVVGAKFRLDPALSTTNATDVNDRLAAAGVNERELPWYLSGVVGSVAVGSTRTADATSADPMRGLTPPSSDAVVFDPGRPASDAPPPATTAPPQVLGVEFWYQAIEPVLGPDAARAAALLWTGDSSSTSVVDGRACITSTITTGGAADQATLQAAFAGWVQSRPGSSAATVGPTSDGTPSVVVSMCAPTEPGLAVPTASSDAMRVFFDRAETERAVVQRIAELGSSTTPAANAACVVAAARNGAIPGFDPVSTDPALLTALSNVAAFCSAG